MAYPLLKSAAFYGGAWRGATVSVLGCPKLWRRSQPMHVTPYLMFPGTCEEAFDFYAETLKTTRRW
jgi:hypothetical protein